MGKLTHLNQSGEAHMVNVGDKAVTRRIAIADLIPLCHPLALTHVEIDLQLQLQENCIYCRASVETHERTGVEMEALMAVEIALLTVYDMCKAVDRGMTLGEIRLLEKSGGKSGTWKRQADPSTA
jgi:cyclic pyranopterin phosphate synthase